MKRVALTLTTLAILFGTANAAFAHGYHGPRHGYYNSFRGPAVMRGHVLTGPTMLVQPPPRVYYRPYYRPAPCYRHRYYAPAPRYNFYYRGRGLSFGIGF